MILSNLGRVESIEVVLFFKAGMLSRNGIGTTDSKEQKDLKQKAQIYLKQCNAQM